MRLLYALRSGTYTRSHPHGHPQWEIGCYTAGSGTAWIGERRIPIETGTLICYPPHITHYEMGVHPFEGMFLLVDQVHGLVDPPAPVCDSPDQIGTRICTLIVDLFAQFGVDSADLHQPLLEGLLAHVRRQSHPLGRHDLVDRLVRLLHGGVTDPDFSVAEAFSSLPMSRDHLRRLFCQQMGHTPIQYLTRLRIARAQELLRMGRSVKQTSEESGFDDPYYFSRVFRAATGKPPREWHQTS